jgi:Putative auto-transporter adhesin, head GIN domain
VIVVLFTAATTATLLLAHYDVFGGSTSSTPAQRTGVAATQQRHLAPFRSVELAGSNNVTIRVGGNQSVLVHADENLLQHVTTVVRAGRLVIGNTPGSFTSTTPMSVEIRMPSLSSVTLSGSGNVFATGIKASSLRMSLPGSGVLRADGSALKVTATLGGSGDEQLGRLSASNVHAFLRGSGRIVVNTTHSLDASVAGNGAIIYYGHPTFLTRNVTGNGAIIQRTE